MKSPLKCSQLRFTSFTELLAYSFDRFSFGEFKPLQGRTNDLAQELICPVDMLFACVGYGRFARSVIDFYCFVICAIVAHESDEQTDFNLLRCRVPEELQELTATAFNIKINAACRRHVSIDDILNLSEELFFVLRRHLFLLNHQV